MTTLTTSTQIANIALGLNGVTAQITTLGTDGDAKDDLYNLMYAPARDELIELFPWNEYVQHRALVLTSGYYEYNQEYTYNPITITGITAADPAVVTAASHGFVTGDNVIIYDVLGMTQVNRGEPFHITKSDANSFSLTGIDSTNWTAYTSGGKCYKYEPLARYQGGNVYDLPSDFVYAIDLQSGEDFELKGIAGNVKLLTVADDAVLKYIAADPNDASTITYWTSLFVNVFSLRLAIKTAPGILGVKEARFHIRDILQPAYDRALNEAVYFSATNKRRTMNTTDPWVIRRGGAGGRDGYWAGGRYVYTSSSQKID